VSLTTRAFCTGFGIPQLNFAVDDAVTANPEQLLIVKVTYSRSKSFKFFHGLKFSQCTLYFRRGCESDISLLIWETVALKKAVL